MAQHPIKLSLPTFILAFFLSMLASSHAIGAWDILNNLFSKHAQYQVKVVDENNQPIPYAALWVMYAGESAPDLSV